MHTVLLVEDNLDILENLSESLELEGYKTLMCNTGKTGIECLAQISPDLIVCDIGMPDMDGYEFIILLLDMPEHCEIPFIFSTSKSEKNDVKKALEIGADRIITKPYLTIDLLLMIDELIISGSKRRRMAS
jgi:CheY-like chemotaxis protein